MQMQAGETDDQMDALTDCLCLSTKGECILCALLSQLLCFFLCLRKRWREA